MKLSIVATLTLAMAVVASPTESVGRPFGYPEHQDRLSVAQAAQKCHSGNVACCDHVKNIRGDGILGNLLAGGILTTLLGSEDVACAKTDLIDNLELLALLDENRHDPSCKEIVACCEEGRGCERMDDHDRERENGLGRGF